MEQSSTDSSSDGDPSLIGDDLEKRFSTKIRRAILGAPRSIKDPGVFHRISLIAFLAWIRGTRTLFVGIWPG